MSVYARESAPAFDAALASLAVQTVLPAEIVLVKDGPLTADLDAVIERYRQSLPIRLIDLPTNGGLANALNEGLRTITQPWVMRFDSDDVCVPTRLEAQMAWMQAGNVDLFGGQIDEFDTNPAQPMRQRMVPLTHQEIMRFARQRNPFNHMTVCYRTQLVQEVGGYPAIPYMEDYALWLTLLSRGARTGNLPEVLVHARVGNGMVERRGGTAYVRSEWRLQALMRDLQLKSSLHCVCDGALRSAVFLAPLSLRRLVYRDVLRAR